MIKISISGPAGSGKSFLASIIYRKLKKLNYNVKVNSEHAHHVNHIIQMSDKLTKKRLKKTKLANLNREVVIQEKQENRNG